MTSYSKNCLLLIIFISIFFILSSLISSNYEIFTRFYSYQTSSNLSKIENSIRHPFNCHDIIHGKLSEIRKAERWQFDQVIDDITCPFLIFNYTKLINLEKESNFPLAFTIIAYKNPNQLNRLLRVIYRPWNFYCIHLDQKADPEMMRLLSVITECYENIWLSDQRYNVKWGEPTLLHASLSCQKILYSKSKKWIYLLNIAATDFPMRSNLDMVSDLESMQGASDIQITDLSQWDTWKYKYSFKHMNGTGAAVAEYTSAFANHRNRSFPIKAKPPFGLKLKKGSFSAAMHRDFVKFLLHDFRVKEFLDYLNDTFIADEVFWSTLYHGYDFMQNITRFRTRYTHWGSYEPKCQGYYEHGLCVFGVRDLKWLLKSGGEYFFAHKFDEIYQPIVLECLEEYIFNKTYV